MADPAPLVGRHALITGASSGIGHATARALAAAGARITAHGRNITALQKLADEIPGLATLAGDLRDTADLDVVCAAAADCDILVNNAGTLRHAPFLETPAADWRAVFELNVFAVLSLAQAAGRGMSQRGRGDIVLISSLLARRTAPFATIYAASKHAVAALAGGLRRELGPAGVRITEVAPGLVHTAIQRDIRHPDVTQSYAGMAFDWLAPEDIATAILSAVDARPGLCTDLIELRPAGQG